MTSRIIVPKIATLENVALELGDVVSVRNLAIAPIYGDDSFNDGTILIGEAIEKAKKEETLDKFTVTESKKVKSLTIKNDLGQRVFIAEGQVVEGDSQNRMAIYSTVIPARSSGVDLPVRCVQRRRGLVGSSRYSGSHTVIMPALRGNEQDRTWTTILADVRSSRVRPNRDYRSDQDKTWDAITTVTRILNQTQILDLRDVRHENFSDVIDHAKLEEYLDGFKKTADPSQIGYVAAVGRTDGDFDLYTDLFGNHKHLDGLYERLLASAAFVAQLHNQHSMHKHKRELVLEDVNQDTLAPFLEAIAEAKVDRVKRVGEPQSSLERNQGLPEYMWLDADKSQLRRTVGEGDLYRLKGMVDGSALLTDGNYVQVFAKQILN